MVTLLTNLTRYLRGKGVNILYTYSPDKLKEGEQYLNDVGFFQLFMGDDFPHHSSRHKRGSFIEIIEPDKKQFSDILENTFGNWFSKQLGVNKLRIGGLIGSIGEVFNNIKDHSGVDTGCMFAQHHPNLNKIIVSISDIGVGIPNNIRRVKECVSDSDAIKLALTEGFSTKSTPRNRGAGLSTLNEYIINSKGEIRIFSGNAYYENIQDSGQFVDKDIYYYGTSIELVFNTEHILLDDDTAEDLEWDF